MRYFLLFLVFFFTSTLGFTQEFPAELVAQHIQEIKIKSEKTKDLTVEIDKSNYQEQMLLATQTERGLLTGDKGLGKFQKTSFGKFRLISCYGGISKSDQIFLMLEGLLEYGWRLQKPVIDVEKNAAVLEEKILFPINSFKEKNTSYYENEVLIPLLYTVDKNLELFDVAKNISLTACQNQKCVTEQISVNLVLSRENTLQTDVCPRMLHALQKVPVDPIHGEVIQSYFNVIDQKNVQLIVDFNDKIKSLNLQIQTESDWRIVHKELHEKRALLTLKVEDVKKLEGIEVYLLSSLGAFKVLPAIKTGEFMFVNKELSYWNVFYAGLWLFFLSPLFLLFWQLPETKEKLIKQVHKIRITSFLLAFILFLFCYFGGDLISLFETKRMSGLLAFVTLCLLIIKPYISLKWAIVLFFILPKPYLLETLYALDMQSLQSLLVFVILVFVATMPFALFQEVPQFFMAVKKVKQYKYIIRFPQIVLLLWLMINIIGGFVFKSVSSAEFEQARSEGKTIFLSVENGYSFVSLLNKISASYLKNHSSVVKGGELTVLTIKSYSKDGELFVNEKHLLPITQGYLYGEKQSYPLIVEDYVSLEKWSDVLSRVTEVGRFSDYLK